MNMWLVLKRTVASGSEESRLFILLCLDVLIRDHVPGLTSGVVVERHHRSPTSRLQAASASAWQQQGEVWRCPGSDLQ